MNRVTTIARRELLSYFCLPIAYVAMTVFLLACGFLFWDDFQPGKIAGMRNLFDWMVWLLVSIVPLLSMGLLAQEWATGTIETMMTAPLGETEVVLGKFFGSFFFFLALLIPTLFYVSVLSLFAVPTIDIGPIASGYLGIILVGGLFIAIGLFCSSLTRSQVVAAVATAAVLFLITIVPWWISGTSTSAILTEISNQAVFKRYTDFSRGVIDTGNVVFFVLTTAVFLFLTIKVLESRRWK
ncbi:MAG: ABC transporter permease subunit [Tepidisphaeraceae bacterium]|jgi:ABC-2 type transport system permease protein